MPQWRNRPYYYKINQRFARNTVILLETIRELKEINVDVFFEEQNIHSISPDGELMVTILSSYAQEESYSASENRKWRARKDFEKRDYWKYNYVRISQKCRWCS